MLVTTISTLPKNIYHELDTVGASVLDAMVNRAPFFESYVKVVPSVGVKRLVFVWEVKPIVTVLPKAGSAAQLLSKSREYALSPNMLSLWLSN